MKEKDHKIIRAVLLIIGWLAAGYVLFFCVFGVDWDWNFFKFSPRWSVRLIREMAGILAALTAIWFLAKASRDKASRAVSLLVCFLLAGQAVAWSTAEPLSDSQPVERREIAQATNSEQAMSLIMKIRLDGVFSRKKPSPIWYRGGRLLLMCVPCAFWVWWTLPHSPQPDTINRPL